MPALWLELLSYAAIGIMSGFFAGLLGIGGGLIVGPLLILVYGQLGFAPQHIAHIAVATASSVIIVNASISAMTHAAQHNINWHSAFLLSAGAVTGAFAGALGAAHITGKYISIFLIIFLLVNTIGMLMPARTAAGGAPEMPAATRLSFYELLPVGGVVGAVSAILGIGGGALTVPYLCWRKIFIRRAIATSAFMGIPLASASTAGYVWSGRAVDNLPDGALGYVYLPALAGIAVFGIISAYYGARLTGRLSAGRLQKVFALMTAGIALSLLWRIL